MQIRFLFLSISCLFCSINLFAQTLAVETLHPNLNASGGLTIDKEGNIYVADFGPALGQVPEETKVYKIDKDDFSVSVFAEGFQGASGCTFDSKGNYYQSNPFGHQVSKRTPDGKIIYDWANEGLKTPIGVIANSEDEIFVCSCGGNAIYQIAENGQTTVFAQDTLFKCPNGLTLDDEDNLYACNFGNGRVLKITPEGKVSLLATLPELSGGPSPVGNGHLTFAHGSLFVTTIGTGQLFRVSLDGKYELLAGKAFGFSNVDGPAETATFSKPNGIIASKDGNMLFINCSEPTWTTNPKGLHPASLRVVKGICGLEDTDCE